MKAVINKTSLELVQGDITDLDTDAIVNAANSRLKMGGGVAGAIKRRGGPAIQRECDEIVSRYGPVPAGGAVITKGGALKARYVIHAVGPHLGEGDEDRKLRRATMNSLKLADEFRLKSIAFPAVSTGIFGFPKDRCAEIMLSTTIEYLEGVTNINEVVFCLYDSETFEIFKRKMESLIQDSEG